MYKLKLVPDSIADNWTGGQGTGDALHTVRYLFAAGHGANCDVFQFDAGKCLNF